MISNTIKDIIGSSLWGADPDFLDLETDKFLIIERIMEHGGINRSNLFSPITGLKILSM